MEKSTRILLLFCIALCTVAPAFALISSPFPETVPFASNNCDLPAPGNFHVESRGYDFVDLAWNPVSAASLHTLFVYTRTDSTDAWEPFGTFDDLPGDSFSLEGVGFEHQCRLVIVTNCASGEPSSKQFVLELDKIILDLITPGRVPINPVVVDCHNININKHEWVGFKVEEILPGNQVAVNNVHLFEFEMPSKGNIRIKRVNQGGVIVAADNSYHYPNFPGQIFPVFYPFLITKPLPNGDFQDIGRVSVILHEDNPFVDICIASGPPKWNIGNYAFSALVAEKTEERPESNMKIKAQTLKSSRKNPIDEVKLNSPFAETITLFTSEFVQNGGIVKVRIFNISGQIVLETQFVDLIGQMSIETDKLMPGLYFVRIEDDLSSKTVKAIKAKK